MSEPLLETAFRCASRLSPSDQTELASRILHEVAPEILDAQRPEETRRWEWNPLMPRHFIPLR